MSEFAKLSTNATSASTSQVGMKRKVSGEVTTTETARDGKENQEVKKQKVCVCLCE